MTLKDEIRRKRQDIVCDSYPMSIGEVANIYRDGEIDVHPEFQRFFRWDEDQKTRFIESILLGIPVPPIFVSQKTNGTWDVIDGQQRLSTVLQFLHLLKKSDDSLYDPLILKKTKFLPSLEGVSWEDETTFSTEQKIAFKREKLSFIIIKETSDNDLSKYEMFQRLNTSGSHLSAQELRNCLILMINKSLYTLMSSLNSNEDFKTCLPLTDSQLEESYDMELVVRFLLYTQFDTSFLSAVDKSKSMDLFLTEELEKYATQSSNFEEIRSKFDKVFHILSQTLGENAFRKYQDDKFRGPFMVASFEAIVPGLFNSLDKWESNPTDLIEKIKQIYSQTQFTDAMRRGTRAVDRMSQLIQFSRIWFCQ